MTTNQRSLARRPDRQRPPQLFEDIIHGKPEYVMGKIALHIAHGRLVGKSEPKPVPGTTDEIAVKVVLNCPPEGAAAPSTALAVPRQAAPAPLRHPAVKPAWSTERKLGVFAAAALPVSALLGWVVNQLWAAELTQAAITVAAFALGILGVFALVQALRGHKATCTGHCPGCKG